MKHTLLGILFLSSVIALSACSKKDDIKPESSKEPIDTTQNGNTPTDTIPPVPEITGYKYYGAELYSKESFKYGRFEARMKMAYAPGCISSMFLYYNNSDVSGSTIWNEIDIEVVGTSKRRFQSNIITGNRNSKTTSEQTHQVSGAIDTIYHIYTIEWTPDYISWSLDGEVVRKTEINDTKGQVAYLTEKESIRFNLWASSSTGWVGTMNPDKIPITQHIDYVKVYDYDTENKIFTEKWTDDFDGEFNTTRWNRGDWRMDLVTERPANVYIENGELLLNLTKEPIYAK